MPHAEWESNGLARTVVYRHGMYACLYARTQARLHIYEPRELYSCFLKTVIMYQINVKKRKSAHTARAKYHHHRHVCINVSSILYRNHQHVENTFTMIIIKQHHASMPPCADRARYECVCVCEYKCNIRLHCRVSYNFIVLIKSVFFVFFFFSFFSCIVRNFCCWW